MILGIVICGIAVILSFFIYDIDDQDAPRAETGTEVLEAKTSGDPPLPHPVKLSLLVLIFCGLLYGVISIGQNNGKLLLQYQLEAQLSVDQVVYYLGIAWFVSRVIRILVDLAYPAIHRLFQYKVAILLLLWAAMSITLILLGFFLPVDFAQRMLLIASGFALMPAIRDPLHIFCQTVLFKKVDKADRKNALVYLVVMQQAGQFLFSLVASIMLLFLPLQYTIVAVAIAIVPMLFLAIRLGRLLRRS